LRRSQGVRIQESTQKPGHRNLKGLNFYNGLLEMISAFNIGERKSVVAAEDVDLMLFLQQSID
jgi:hypothetical protein